MDISVMLTPHFGDIDPPHRNGSKNRKHDNITSFFLNFLLSIQCGARCVPTGLK
jgi:hypothetical protein